MADYLKTPVGGIPVGVYALIGITTGILAYTTLADESGEQSVADNTANVLPTLNLFKDEADAAEQSGGRKKQRKHRKTPRKKGATRKNKYNR